MDYKIIEKPAFEVIGEGRIFTTENQENFRKIPLFWDEFIEKKHLETLMNVAKGKTGPVTGAHSLGVCIAIEPMVKFTYVIGIEKPDAPVPAGFQVYQIPATTWAIFESVGPMPKAIQGVTTKIFQEWFPSTGYEHDAKPELEVYLPGDPNSQDYRCQVWMPVVKKN